MSPGVWHDRSKFTFYRIRVAGAGGGGRGGGADQSPPQTITLSGTGGPHPHFNDSWNLDKAGQNGKVCYRRRGNHGDLVKWDGKRWTVNGTGPFQGDNCAYWHGIDTPWPPASGWQHHPKWQQSIAIAGGCETSGLSEARGDDAIFMDPASWATSRDAKMQSKDGGIIGVGGQGVDCWKAWMRDGLVTMGRELVVFEAEMHGITDTGVYLRYDALTQTGVGCHFRRVRGDTQNGDLYWHYRKRNDWGAQLAKVSNMKWSEHSVVKLRIEAEGDDYRVFVDGQLKNTFHGADSPKTGTFGLYWYAGDIGHSGTFRNVRIISAPASGSSSLGVADLACETSGLSEARGDDAIEIEVVGAGRLECNGVYRPDGEWRGYQRWKNDNNKVWLRRGGNGWEWRWYLVNCRERSDPNPNFYKADGHKSVVPPTYGWSNDGGGGGVPSLILREGRGGGGNDAIHLGGVTDLLHSASSSVMGMFSPSGSEEGASNTAPIVEGVVVEPSVATAGEAIHLTGTSSGSAPPLLIDVVNILKKELGISGNITQVVAAACDQLGVETTGKNLAEQAAECWRLVVSA